MIEGTEKVHQTGGAKYIEGRRLTIEWFVQLLKVFEDEVAVILTMPVPSLAEDLNRYTRICMPYSNTL